MCGVRVVWIRVGQGVCGRVHVVGCRCVCDCVWMCVFVDVCEVVAVCM